MSLTQEAILDALKAIQDPDLHKDIVALGFVKDVKINGGAVDFTIELTTPACPVKDQMKAQAEAIVGGMPGVSSVMVNMTAQVRARGGMTSQAIPGIRNVIAVGAGKGGVGKSTTTVNLAIALAKAGARVGIMDADVYGPNLPQMLGIEMEPGSIELTPDQKMIPPIAHGVKALSIGMLVPKDQAVIWRGPMLHSAVQQFMRDVAWGELDYLLVDLPPGTGDVAISLAQSVGVAGAVVVTTPQGVSVSDVRKAIGMFQKLNIPILGVVENMSYFICPNCTERHEIFGKGGGAEIAKDLKIPLLGDIPIDMRVRSGGDEGTPVVVAAPDSPAAQALSTIASKVAARISMQAMKTL
ncbi:MAG: Mrp/NBP35 family ATP-binding protein, partial [Vicinamibacteria bacterium]